MTTAASSHCATSVILPFRLANDGSIDPRVPSRRRLRRETRERDHSPGAAQVRAAIGAIEQPVERDGERVDVAGRHEDARPLVVRPCRSARRTRSHDGRLAQLRFDGDEPEPLVSRRHDQRGGAAVQVDQRRLRKLSQPVDAVRDAERAARARRARGRARRHRRRRARRRRVMRAIASSSGPIPFCAVRRPTNSKRSVSRCAAG